jgi:predicted Co/Zn/Cd cation transporter (cation efflux family)
MAQSEVARLMQQIALEYQAAQRALESVAMTAQHEFITKRMENMSSIRDELARHVGEDAATRMLCESCCTGETEKKAEEKRTK